MKTNTLVKKPGREEIGVVCRILKKTVEVRWNEMLFEKIRPEKLCICECQGREFIGFTDFKRQTFTNTVEKTRVILGNELKEWTGIGWVKLRLISEKDLSSYPRIVEDHISQATNLGLLS